MSGCCKLRSNGYTCLSTGMPKEGEGLAPELFPWRAGAHVPTYQATRESDVRQQSAYLSELIWNQGMESSCRHAHPTSQTGATLGTDTAPVGDGDSLHVSLSTKHQCLLCSNLEPGTGCCHHQQEMHSLIIGYNQVAPTIPD